MIGENDGPSQNDGPWKAGNSIPFLKMANSWYQHVRSTGL